jgi:hypothetical protein
MPFRLLRVSSLRRSIQQDIILYHTRSGGNKFSADTDTTADPAGKIPGKPLDIPGKRCRMFLKVKDSQI